MYGFSRNCLESASSRVSFSRLEIKDILKGSTLTWKNLFLPLFPVGTVSAHLHLPLPLFDDGFPWNFLLGWASSKTSFCRSEISDTLINVGVIRRKLFYGSIGCGHTFVMAAKQLRNGYSHIVVPYCRPPRNVMEISKWQSEALNEPHSRKQFQGNPFSNWKQAKINAVRREFWKERGKNRFFLMVIDHFRMCKMEPSISCIQKNFQRNPSTHWEVVKVNSSTRSLLLASV